MARPIVADLPLTTLRLSQDGPVLTVRIDAPPHDYMTAAMQQDFLDLVRAVDADGTVRAVVVTGAGPGRYLAHYDIGDLLVAAEAAPLLPRPAARLLLGAVRAVTAAGGERLIDRSRLSGILAITRFHELVTRLLRSRVIWIAAIDGPCGGGGLEMSVCFDIRVAADTASFLLPELSIGLTTTVGAQRLVHLMGPARALRMMLEARAWSAAEAQDAGLVERVLPAGDVVVEAQAMAARYARRSPTAVAAQKRIINTAYDVGLRAGLTEEGVAQMTNVPTARTRASLRTWLSMQSADGASVFRTDPEPWADGTAVAETSLTTARDAV
ncbi:enoyl-CoA hydratase/isomerase family protein [Cryptosporangium arvum]|uniref:Enoyl-CoA hydratase/carnithine racemase n=1 Tax=Cryptosporangium arvum DSM 44712 TaxID=927661 RepID=A0A010Z4X4_9ACTN|nr:enoyl-CoA hydratase/isomerase family protein [Cryptosporangium arvum]EXG82398.1 enoyl-CoA hydratase/carnithine racemase [Cryptosporangium arvum DSM 44712]